MNQQQQQVVESEIVRGGKGGTVRRILLVMAAFLMALAFLGVMAAILEPRMGEEARFTAAQTQIACFKTALDAFQADNGSYPAGKDGLMALVRRPPDATNWHGPYLDHIPKDPWGNPYHYERPGKHNPTFFDISSQGKPGAKAPIGNWVVGESSTISPQRGEQQIPKYSLT